jgi:arylformamidase
MNYDVKAKRPHVSVAERHFWDQNFRFSEILSDFSTCLQGQIERSAAYRSQRQLSNALPETHRYGTHPRQFVRAYCAPAAPDRACIFVHGGYWRALSADDHDFVGLDLKSDIDFYNVEYRLQPEVGFEAQIGDVRHALEKAISRCRSRGVSQIDIVGHSAGAHLALCALRPLKTTGIAAAGEKITLCCISGIYDLEPISRCFLADELVFTLADIELFSPLRTLSSSIDIVYNIFVGEHETPEYLRQSFSLVSLLKKHGCDANFRLLGNAHHMQSIQVFMTGQ